LHGNISFILFVNPFTDNGYIIDKMEEIARK